MMNIDIQSAVAELKALSKPTPRSPVLPTDALLDACEKDLGVKLSDDYRYFLKEASDVFVNTLDPLKVTEERDHPTELVTTAREAWSLGVPKDWLPICEDNGDYYCITKAGEIRFWDHNGYSEEAWPSLAHWIKEVWIDGS